MQSSFSDAEYASKKKLTRRDRFLAEIEAATPWPALVAAILPYYPKGYGRGRPRLVWSAFCACTLPSSASVCRTKASKTRSTTIQDVKAFPVICQRCAHQLGNLTLSGYNSKLGTVEFMKKDDGQNDMADFIGHRDRLYAPKSRRNRS